MTYERLIAMGYKPIVATLAMIAVNAWHDGVEVSKLTLECLALEYNSDMPAAALALLDCELPQDGPHRTEFTNWLADITASEKKGEMA